MKAFNVIAVSVFVGAVGFITWSLVKDSHKRYYITTHAEETTIEENLNLPGFVYPSKEIEVKPQLSGVVDAVFVSVGDAVKVGDPIASVSLVPNSSEVENLTSSVNVAKISLTTAEATYERQKTLLENKAISRTEYEASEREYLTAKETYETARHQLNLRQKNQRTENNIVRSSTSGTIIDVPVKPGSSVVERSSYNVGTTVATIASSDVYVFSADVPEKNIGKLHVGAPVKITLLAYEDMLIEAMITKISSKGKIDNGAVKFPLEAQFTVPDKSVELRSGYSASGEVLLTRKENVMSLPEKCVNFKGDTTYVYLTDSLKHSVKEQIIKLGLSDGERIEILDGLSKKDFVITNYHD